MNHSGDAAEQIVRMSLEGVEVAARISGAAAKEIALLLLAALKSPEKNQTGNLKLRGKARLESMLKSGKALEIFSVKESDLRTFAREAKRYGIVYCILRNSKNTPDGLCDIMVKADDAPKINRIVERFQFATVDKAQVENEIVQAGDNPAAEPVAEASGSAAEAEQEAAQESPEINDVDQLLDEFLGAGESRPAPEPMETELEAKPKTETKPKTESEPGRFAKPKLIRENAAQTETPENPSAALTAETRPSEPISENRSRSAKGTSNKPSMKAEIRDITAARKDYPQIIHKQPAWDKKPIQPKVR
jgi:hypothetical protein